MKKLYTLAGAFLMAGALFAQLNTTTHPKLPSVEMSGRHNVKAFDGSSDLATAKRGGSRAIGDTIMYESFGGGFPASWSKADNAGFAGWVQTTAATAGEWAPGFTFANATSGSDGWMLYDVDAYNNPGGSTAGDAYFQTGVMDLSAFGDILLKFEARHIRCCSGAGTFTVDLSIDGGATFPTSFDILGEVAINAFSDDPDVKQYNIGTFVGGQSNVVIRWNWTGSSHYWGMIDDVLLTEGPASDLAIMEEFGSYLDPFLTTYYSKIPRSLADTLHLGANVTNNASYVSNAVMMETWVESLTDLEYYTSVAPITSDASTGLETLDTTFADNGKFILPENGIYTVTHFVSSDSTDANPTDNIFQVQFEISDTVYARDNGTVDFANDNNSFTNVTATDYAFGNGYEFIYSDTITSISFIPSGNTGNVRIKLIEFDGANFVDVSGFPFITYTVQSGDLDNWVTVDIPGDGWVIGSSFYIAAVQNLSGGVQIAGNDITTGGMWDGTNSNGGYGYLDGQWYNILGSNYAVRINMNNVVNPCDDLVALNETVEGLTCAGSGDGNITVAPTGSTAYTYMWENGATDAMVTGLAGGEFNLTLTTAEGCTRYKSFFLDEAAPLTLAMTAVDDTCSLGKGMASVSVTNGTDNYSYAWDNGMFGDTIANISAGVYTVTVSKGQCEFSSSVTVLNAESSITVTGNVTDDNCDYDEGAITAAATGSNNGTTYTYEWNTGDMGATITDLMNGVYSVTATDAVGCASSESFTVSDATVGVNLTISENSAATSCVAADGEAEVGVTASNGTPFTYMWTDGQTTAVATGLEGGVHMVTVTDGSGCIEVEGQFVTSAGNSVTITTSSTDLTCFEDMTGTANVTVTTSGGGYTVNWYDGMFNSVATTETVTGLGADEYSVIVVDVATSCTQAGSETISQPDELVVSLASSSDVLCAGGTNGDASVSVAGGPSTSYAYMWDDVAMSTTAAITGLTDGTYNVTVTSGACATDFQVVIDAGSTINANEGSNDVSCFGESDGDVFVAPTGGTPAYSFQWDDAANSTTVQVVNVPAGAYNCTITDANSCSTVASVTVSENAAVSASIADGNGSTTPTFCPGTSGDITASATGGAGSFTYTWAHTANTSATQTVAAGTYSVIVTDGNGCTGNASITVSEYAGGALVATASVLTPDSIGNCSSSNEGSVSVNVTGGTAPYDYIWSGPGMTIPPLTATVTGLQGDGTAAYTYSVDVTDANGCTGSSSVQMTTADCPNSIEEVSSYDALKVYPNPNGGKFTVEFVNASNDSYRISVRNVIGQTVTERVINISGNYTEIINLDGVEAGVYLLNVKGSNSESTHKIVVE